MKHKKLWVFLLSVLLLLVGSIMLAVNAGKTPQEIANQLRRELDLREDASVVCVSKLVEDGASIRNALPDEENALFFFSVKEQGRRFYAAAVCRALKNGNYRVKRIETPMTCAQDIVMMSMRKDVILINNPDCRWVMKNGGTSKTEISPEEIPYLYISAGGMTIDFLDADGNSIPLVDAGNHIK